MFYITKYRFIRSYTSLQDEWIIETNLISLRASSRGRYNGLVRPSTIWSIEKELLEETRIEPIAEWNSVSCMSETQDLYFVNRRILGRSLVDQWLWRRGDIHFFHEIIMNPQIFVVTSAIGMCSSFRRRSSKRFLLYWWLDNVTKAKINYVSICIYRCLFPCFQSILHLKIPKDSRNCQCEGKFPDYVFRRDNVELNLLSANEHLSACA